MKAVRFGFWFLITMIMVQLLTLISFVNPELYWISPLYPLIDLLTNLNIDNIGIIIVFIIYPLLFQIPWLIMYIFILITNTNRYLGKQRFLTLSILGIIEFFMSLVRMSFLVYRLVIGNSDSQLYNLMVSSTGVFAIVFLLLKVLLPNHGYLKQYKIYTVASLVLYYAIYWIIYSLIYTSRRPSVLFLTESLDVFLALIAAASYYYLMKYLQFENVDEIASKNYLD